MERKEYIIREDEDYEKGDGIKVYIEDGNFICDMTAEGGYVGYKLCCDIETLIYQIEKYKEVLKRR